MALLVCRQQALEEFRSARPELSLDWNAPVLNLVDSGITDFLETQIASLTIPHPVSDVVEAFETVFSSPEMVQRATALKMENHTAKIATRRPGDPNEHPLYLEKVSAREALNAIAQRWGRGAWIYTESDYGEKRVFYLEQYFKARSKPPGIRLRQHLAIRWQHS